MEGKIIRVVFDKIPGIGIDLIFYLTVEAGGTEDGYMTVTAQTHPQQMIKTYKVIHMGMRNEDMLDLKNFSRAQIMKITQIEKKRSALMLEFNIYPWVAEGIIDQMGAEHISSLPLGNHHCNDFSYQ
jgi:hypothetical protein